MNRPTETNDFSRKWWLEPGFRRHPQVLYPDQLGERANSCDLFAAENAQREPPAIAWNDVLFEAACGLIAGMLGTVGLAYVIAWVAL